jgi:hypothetical protein
MLHEAGFTQKDLKLLEKFQDLIDRGFKEDLMEKAAIELKMSPVTVRTRLSRMRAKYRDNKAFMKEYRHWQQTLYHRTGGKFHSL